VEAEKRRVFDRPAPRRSWCESVLDESDVLSLSVVVSKENREVLAVGASSRPRGQRVG
jgi:hypothetical protein